MFASEDIGVGFAGDFTGSVVTYGPIRAASFYPKTNSNSASNDRARPDPASGGYFFVLLRFRFDFDLPSFISSCGFGFIRTSAAMRRFVPVKPFDPAVAISRSTLQMARGQAIDAYSALEEILMQVFCHLLGTNLGVGGIVFFRLTNAGLRNRTIEELIERKHGDKFDVYWFGTKNQPALMELVRQVDNTRNQIVHWKPVFRHEIEEFVLRPPNIWNTKPNSPFLTIDDLYEFIAKTDCVRHYAGNFNWRTVRYREGQNSDHARAWLDKFEQPPAYPPPTGHPLYKLWKARRIRPQSSQR